jgi:predicted nuclease of predicted toxin-antitoxin system
MHFIVDAQLPPAVAAWLRTRGYRAEHVFDRFAAHVPDGLIWQYALDNNAAILSKDQDFVMRRQMTLNREGPTVIWLRMGNTGKAVLIAWLETHWAQIETALERGERLIEVR